MKHFLKSSPSKTSSSRSIRDRLDKGNFADQKGRHFLVTNQKDLESAQKLLRRKVGADEIKQNIISIADRKNLEIDESKWRSLKKDLDSEKNI